MKPIVVLKYYNISDKQFQDADYYLRLDSYFFKIRTFFVSKSFYVTFPFFIYLHAVP